MQNPASKKIPQTQDSGHPAPNEVYVPVCKENQPSGKGIRYGPERYSQSFCIVITALETYDGVFASCHR